MIKGLGMYSAVCVGWFSVYAFSYIYLRRLANENNID